MAVTDSKQGVGSRQMKQSHEQSHGVCVMCVVQSHEAASWRAKKERTRRNRATKTLEFFSAVALIVCVGDSRGRAVDFFSFFILLPKKTLEFPCD